MSKQFLFIIAICTIIWNQQKDYFDYKIDKKITMHIARHTFGNIAGDTIHPFMLQKLYRHSDLKTTLNYQANFIHKEADDALDSVVNF